MKQGKGSPVFCMIIPNDIAYVCGIIKNGKDMWDQAKRRMNSHNTEPEKKAKPLFSTGEGKKRERVVSQCGTCKILSSTIMWRRIGERSTIPRKNLQY
jgi:hypothetical protein